MTNTTTCDNCGKSIPTTEDDIELLWLKVSDWTGGLSWDACSTECLTAIVAEKVTPRFNEILAEIAEDAEPATS